MAIPGMYLLVKCDNQVCSFCSKILPLYVGSHGKFDIFHCAKLARCSNCCLRIKSIEAILFASCIWGYRGLIKGEKKVTTETDKKINRIEVFDHKKGIIWDWLVINIKPLQQHLVIDRYSNIEESKNFSKIIDDMISQFSTAGQITKYYKRYDQVSQIFEFGEQSVEEGQNNLSVISKT